MKNNIETAIVKVGCCPDPTMITIQLVERKQVHYSHNMDHVRQFLTEMSFSCHTVIGQHLKKGIEIQFWSTANAVSI